MNTMNLDSIMEDLATAATHAAKRGHEDIAELIETVMGRSQTWSPMPTTSELNRAKAAKLLA